MYSKIFKRSLDLIITIPAIIIALPFIILIAVLLKITGHQKIFFIQKRVGYKEQIFSLYKICTMTEHRDQEGNLMPDADRLTSVGKFIRKTSLDEIPQLWNVIKGDMSLIGPRPLLIEYIPLYNAEQKNDIICVRASPVGHR